MKSLSIINCEVGFEAELFYSDFIQLTRLINIKDTQTLGNNLFFYIFLIIIKKISIIIDEFNDSSKCIETPILRLILNYI